MDSLMQSFKEDALDLSSVISKGLITTNQQLLEWVKSWQDGVDKRGERQFMRLLYEKTNDAAEGSSLLRAELSKAFALVQQVSDLGFSSFSYAEN
jgi:hypothetical protein